MSGNIHDTNIHTIKKQVNDLLLELDSLNKKNEDITEWESYLQNKYKTLYKTSKTLYNYILKNYNSDKFDSSFFNTTLNLMLSKISSIQKNNVSQDDASVHIGTHLAETFIPQLKKN